MEVSIWGCLAIIILSLLLEEYSAVALADDDKTLLRPDRRCKFIGQFLSHPSSRCMFVRCDYGNKPWHNSYSKAKLFARDMSCAPGTSVPAYFDTALLQGNPCIDRTFGKFCKGGETKSKSSLFRGIGLRGGLYSYSKFRRPAYPEPRKLTSLPKPKQVEYAKQNYVRPSGIHDEEAPNEEKPTYYPKEDWRAKGYPKERDDFEKRQTTESKKHSLKGYHSPKGYSTYTKNIEPVSMPAYNRIYSSGEGYYEKSDITGNAHKGRHLPKYEESSYKYKPNDAYSAKSAHAVKEDYSSLKGDYRSQYDIPTKKYQSKNDYYNNHAPVKLTIDYHRATSSEDGYGKSERDSVPKDLRSRPTEDYKSREHHDMVYNADHDHGFDSRHDYSRPQGGNRFKADHPPSPKSDNGREEDYEFSLSGNHRDHSDDFPPAVRAKSYDPKHESHQTPPTAGSEYDHGRDYHTTRKNDHDDPKHDRHYSSKMDYDRTSDYQEYPVDAKHDYADQDYPMQGHHPKYSVLFPPGDVHLNSYDKIVDEKGYEFLQDDSSDFKSSVRSVGRNAREASNGPYDYTEEVRPLVVTADDPAEIGSHDEIEFPASVIKGEEGRTPGNKEDGVLTTEDNKDTAVKVKEPSEETSDSPNQKDELDKPVFPFLKEVMDTIKKNFPSVNGRSQEGSIDEDMEQRKVDQYPEDRTKNQFV